MTPIADVGVAVPVPAGVVQDERPSLIQVPVVAIALAYARLGERLRSNQALGVALAPVGVLLINGGA